MKKISPESLLGKKVRVYSTYGRKTEGILHSFERPELTLIGTDREKNADKIIVMNFHNVFMIEEQ